jgi:hypothetical protein
MEQVQAGDIWVVLVGGQKREVKIIGPASVPGWWSCRDIATGVEFVAREGWLIERIGSGDD